MPYEVWPDNCKAIWQVYPHRISYRILGKAKKEALYCTGPKGQVVGKFKNALQTCQLFLELGLGGPAQTTTALEASTTPVSRPAPGFLVFAQEAQVGQQKRNLRLVDLCFVLFLFVLLAWWPGDEDGKRDRRIRRGEVLADQLLMRDEVREELLGRFWSLMPRVAHIRRVRSEGPGLGEGLCSHFLVMLWCKLQLRLRAKCTNSWTAISIARPQPIWFVLPWKRQFVFGNQKQINGRRSCRGGGTSGSGRWHRNSSRPNWNGKRCLHSKDPPEQDVHGHQLRPEEVGNWAKGLASSRG